RVLDEEKIRKTNWYRRQPFTLLGEPPRPLERLLKELEVRPRQKTELIDVTMATETSGEAALIVNAVVSHYRKESSAEINDARTEKLKELKKRRDALAEQIAAASRQLLDIKVGFNGNLPKGRVEQLSTDLAEARRELSRLHVEQQVDAFRIEQFAKQWAATQAQAPVDSESDHLTGSSAYANDATWFQQNQDVDTKRHQLEVARQRYGGEHPQIEALQSELVYALDQLCKIEQRLDANPLLNTESLEAQQDGQVTTPSRLKARQAVRQTRIDLLQERAGKLQTTIADTNKLAREQADERADLARKRRLLDQIDERIKILDTERTPGRISIASIALAGKRPSRDRRLMLTALALCAAIMIGIAAGYLRTMMDPAIHEAGDIAGVTRTPFLGQLPDLSDMLPDPLDWRSNSAVHESVRMVRTAVLRRLSRLGSSAVVVTSPEPNTGKTSVAILLSKSLGQLGKKVLLVDADLQQRSLSLLFDSDDRAGLTSILDGKTVDKAEIVASNGREFDFLPAGTPVSEGDPELLANGAFAAWLQRWKRQYDFVVLDSPPVLSTADARILGEQTDGTIMVLRAAHTRRVDALEAFAGLGAIGARLLGTILTGANESAVYYRKTDHGPSAALADTSPSA
ncbi:MAG: polysaccharide biosynthesis tyrosine autokinase, partial [Dehalococcoidia bacterium]